MMMGARIALILRIYFSIVIKFTEMQRKQSRQNREILMVMHCLLKLNYFKFYGLHSG